MYRNLTLPSPSGLLACLWLFALPLPVLASEGFKLPAAAARLESNTDPRDVVVRFDQPVDEKAVSGITSLWPNLVEYVSAGYDQVLVRGKVPLKASITNGLLTLEPASLISSSAERGAAAAKIRRELTLARLERQRGDLAEAKQRLETLRAEQGDNPEILAALAEGSEARGAWRPARDLYRRAGQLDPGNEYYADAERRMARQGAPFARVETEVANVKGGERQSIAMLQSQAPLTANTDIGLNLERRRLQTGNAVDLRGQTRVVDENHERAELYAAHRFEATGEGRVALLQSGDGITGGALSYAARSHTVTNSISAVYHRAYWELVSGLVNQGTHDQLEARQERILGEGWSGLLALRYNRYGVADEADVTKSAGLLASLRKTVEWETRSLSGGYTMDGEYIHTQQKFNNGAGIYFRPLGISTKEIHSLDATFSEKLTNDLRLDLFAGYGYDRYNDKGPFAGLNLLLTGEESYELGLKASHAKALSRGEQNDVNRLGAYGLLRF